MEGPAGWSSESLHRCLASVIGGNDIAQEVNLVISPWAEVAILIDDLGGDKGEVLAFVIDRQADVVRGACGADGLGADFFARLSGDNLDFARLEAHAPGDVVFGGEAFGLHSCREGTILTRRLCHLERSREISPLRSR